MFANLLREKRTIEEKLRKLQNKYISLRQQSIIGINQSEVEKNNIVKDALVEKQAVLDQIKHEYTELDQVYKNLRTLLSDIKETTSESEEFVEALAELFNIEFPEELKKKEPVKKSVTESAQIQTTDDENQLSDNNKENNVIDDFDSDKENSKVDITPPISSDYYSPILQIRKSAPDNDQLYTPAIRSKNRFRPSHK